MTNTTFSIKQEICYSDSIHINNILLGNDSPIEFLLYVEVILCAGMILCTGRVLQGQGSQIDVFWSFRTATYDLIL